MPVAPKMPPSDSSSIRIKISQPLGVMLMLYILGSWRVSGDIDHGGLLHNA